jgi:hypothetical protein
MPVNSGVDKILLLKMNTSWLKRVEDKIKKMTL